MGEELVPSDVPWEEVDGEIVRDVRPDFGWERWFDPMKGEYTFRLRYNEALIMRMSTDDQMRLDGAIMRVRQLLAKYSMREGRG